jgi:hypothetical protein
MLHAIDVHRRCRILSHNIRRFSADNAARKPNDLQDICLNIRERIRHCIRGRERENGQAFEPQIAADGGCPNALINRSAIIVGLTGPFESNGVPPLFKFTKA